MTDNGAVGRPAESAEKHLEPVQADVSIIVVNWNTRELLRRCLESVYAHGDGLVRDVIVVDNGSIDGSQVMVQQMYPTVRLIQNATNAGFARANNQGAAVAAAPLLLLLNSDAALQPGALQAAVAFMCAHPATGIVGFQLLNDDLTLQPSGKRFPTLLSTMIALSPVPEQWRHAIDRRRNKRDFTQIAEVDEVSAAALMIRRALFEELGGLDEIFYFFGEDIDLCWRAQKEGWRVVYLPNARVIHSWGGSRKTSTPAIRQGLLSQRAQYLLFQRHKPGWQQRILHIYLIFLAVLRILRILLILRQSPRATTHANAQLYMQDLHWLLVHSRQAGSRAKT